MHVQTTAVAEDAGDMALPQNLMAGQGRVTVRFFFPPTRQAMRGDSDTSSETGGKKKDAHECDSSGNWHSRA